MENIEQSPETTGVQVEVEDPKKEKTKLEPIPSIDLGYIGSANDYRLRRGRYVNGKWRPCGSNLP